MNIPNLNVIKRLWNQRSGLAQRRLALKKEKLEEANMETHRISVVVSDPNHTMQTMRKEKIQKRVKVQARDREHAIDSALHHYKKAGYKVHDHHYIGKVNEEVELEEDLRTQLQKHSDAAIAANKAGDDEKVKHHMNKVNAIKDKMAKQARNEEVELDEISKELAGNYVGALAKKQLNKHGMKPNMYDKLPKKHQKGFERAIDRLKEESDLDESRNQADKYYDEAEKHKAEAKKHPVGSESHHHHMANHYDAMHRYHSDIGQHREASKAADKAEDHHEKAYEASRTNEEVAANNVGGGAIAGTQGDAGKKTVMTKEPLKRKKLTDFKEWVELDEAAVDAKGHKSSTGGLTQKGRDYYNNKTGGNLKAPVTTPPSKLDPDSKAAKRRKSFCARMGGMPGPMKDEKGRPTRKALALRKWNC